ncbi:MAG: orotate phosphoribosyltransferase [Armatimonadetes bacterium]|nr:orotate phosphoribosyltransferase [Armatimonadota bacterium]
MEGDFVLSSGAHSTFYLDCRRVTLHPVGALLIGGFVLAHAKSLGVTVIGGPTLAADPIVGASVALSPLYDWPCEGFLVRKSAKEHGTGKLVEGRIAQGQRVLIVEDTITSAGSVLRAIDAVEAEGATVAGVWGLVDRQSGGREALAERGVDLLALFSIRDVQLSASAGAAAVASEATAVNGLSGETS